MVSNAASARYRNVCPKCKARSFEPCRTLKTGRVTDTHLSRVDAANQLMNVMPRRIKQAIPDQPIRIPRYFPVERVVTDSDLDTLAALGYSRSMAMKVLTDR